jgi:hypothetical protein
MVVISKSLDKKCIQAQFLTQTEHFTCVITSQRYFWLQNRSEKTFFFLKHLNFQLKSLLNQHFFLKDMKSFWTFNAYIFKWQFSEWWRKKLIFDKNLVFFHEKGNFSKKCKVKIIVDFNFLIYTLSLNFPMFTVVLFIYSKLNQVLVNRKPKISSNKSDGKLTKTWLGLGPA